MSTGVEPPRHFAVQNTSPPKEGNYGFPPLREGRTTGAGASFFFADIVEVVAEEFPIEMVLSWGRKSLSRRILSSCVSKSKKPNCPLGLLIGLWNREKVRMSIEYRHSPTRQENNGETMIVRGTLKKMKAVFADTPQRESNDCQVVKKGDGGGSPSVGEKMGGGSGA